MKKFLLAAILATMMFSAPAYAGDEVGSEETQEQTAKKDKKEKKEKKDGSSKLILKKGQHPAKQSRPLDLDVTVGVDWWHFQGGLFLDIPIVPNGFSPLNDSFELEIGTYMGLDWHRGDGLKSLYQDILVGVRYSFYLTKQWTVYIRTLGGYGYWYYDKYNNGGYFAWDESVGAYWNFAKGMGLRFDVGWHGANVGLNFKLGGSKESK